MSLSKVPCNIWKKLQKLTQHKSDPKIPLTNQRKMAAEIDSIANQNPQRNAIGVQVTFTRKVSAQRKT